ncbi:MAG: metal-dependent transcriptional regulator [Eubacteriales bacterium]|nr:metal-dependent transcriptional regulator [Eubacteriales bacterium]
MKIQRSAEDYLEAILQLREQLGAVRSIDIARHLDYSKPSVSVAMKNLRAEGYIEMDPDGFITLLPAGQVIAEHIYELHRLLRDFFLSLGVSPENAEADACKIEHDLSQETCQRLMEHIRAQQHKM